jgi:hypothetical protein
MQLAQRRRPGSLLKLMSSTLAPRQPRPSSERIVETAEIEPATGASASAWEAGGSGLKPQALAWTSCDSPLRPLSRFLIRREAGAGRLGARYRGSAERLGQARGPSRGP